MTAPASSAPSPFIGLGAPLQSSTCSRADCRNAGTWRLDWRNPRIHSTDRVKTWLACEDHVHFLRDFLSARDFPLTVSRLDNAATGTTGPVQ